MLFKHETKEFLILLNVFQDCGLNNGHEKYLLLDLTLTISQDYLYWWGALLKA